MGLGDIFRIGVSVLRTTVSEKTKAVLAQLGDSLTNTVETDNAEIWGAGNITYRPSEAVSKGPACEAISIRHTSHDVVICTRDLRGMELQGTLLPGETCVYAPGKDGKAQARVLLKANGSINLYTRAGNTESGAGMGLFINPAEDSISLINSQGYGLLIQADGVFLTSKGAAVKLTPGGDCSLIGKGKCQVDGASVVLGSAAVPGVNSALTGVTGVSGKASLKVLIE